MLPISDERVRQLRSLLEGGHYLSADRMLAAVDSETRCELVQSAPMTVPLATLRAWSAETGSVCADAAIALGLNEEAGELRYASHGTESPRAAEVQDEATKVVESAFSREPNELAVIVASMITARYAGEPARVEARWVGGVERHPQSRSLHLEYLRARSPRWLGSPEAMFSFAIEQAREAPPGDFRILLPLEAHFEMILVALIGHSPYDDVLEPVGAYLSQYEVRVELLYAATRYLGPDPASWSERHPEDLNLLAFLLALASEPVRELFDAIGEERWTAHPWRYFGIPEEMFAQFRAAGAQSKPMGGPRRIADARAGDVVVLRISALAAVFLGVWLLAVAVPQDLAFARARANLPKTMLVTEYETESTTWSSFHLALGTIEGETPPRLVEARVPIGVKRERPERLLVKRIPGSNRYVSEAELRQLRHGIRLPWINLSLLFVMGFAILLFGVFLLTVPLRRKIDSPAAG